MCRLMITTGSIKKVDVMRLIAETAKKFAPTQKDGFGFAAFDETGTLTARGRYYDAYTGWRSGRLDSEVLEEGKFTERTQTLIIHGRTSTNVLGVDFCHPYKEGDTYLAHNGILSFIGPEEEEPLHENDSGSFLEWLEERDHPVPSSWKNSWSGYGALAIARQGRNLEVIKCKGARLTLSFRRHGGYILATCPEDVPGWLKKPKTSPRYLSPGILEFSNASGELIKVRKFPGFAPRKWDKKASLAIGSPEPIIYPYRTPFVFDSKGRAIGR